MAIAAAEVEAFFDRYAAAFLRGLQGAPDIADVRSLYSTQYIAAGPDGVMAGDNDAGFGEWLAKAYDHYRAIGTTAMTVTGVDIHPIDESHCLARVGWNSTFEKDGKRIDIPFTNSYLLERRDGALKAFGWITGDEAKLLKDAGLV
ncbi:hypothetical protein WBP06_14225 [Novosphingobium sp. BL-8H]|uniref:hypothetical protein n=1 Tax=Novosphingobium sp. BL-8H TaxID=3127640 RepID=UPI003758044C